MKKFLYLCISLLILFTVIGADCRLVSAAEGEYTYTVRLYAGNIGVLAEGGVEVSSESAKVKSGKDCIVVDGLKYGDTVYIRPQDAASVTDERYYVKGVRRSGRDNSEAEVPTFHVACDRDYVVAYAIRGDMAAYTVNYQDTAGRTLKKSDTYYGNIGEQQYVSARYIDGYQPQALNMVKTLSANEAENVFTFQYTAAPTQVVTPPAQTTPAAPTQTTATVTPPAPNTNPVTPNEGGEGQETEEPNEEPEPDGEGGTGGNVTVPDDNVPRGQTELEDLDDEQVPLSQIKAEQAGLMGYFPIYMGIGIAAAVVLAIAGIYLYRRHKKAPVRPTKKPGSGSDGTEE